MSNQSKSRRETKGKTARNKARKTARGSAPNRRAPSGTTHVTPPGGNIFADLGFSEPEAAALLQESHKRIDAEIALKKQQRRKRGLRPEPKMSERAMRAALHKLVFDTPIPSYPAVIPPAPARWIPVRQAAQWRKEFAKAAAKRGGKPPRRSRVPRTLTLRTFAERQWPKLNTICLDDGMSLVRLIGVAEDEYDLYYIVQHMGGRRRYVSAVCRCDSLRGALRVDLYQHIERLFNLNGCKPVRGMLILREVYGERAAGGTPKSWSRKKNPERKG